MNNYNINKRQKSFSLIEMLIALFVTMIITHILLISMQGFYQFSLQRTMRIFDEVIAIKQLSFYLNQSTDIIVTQHTVCFNDIHNENYCISENQNRIVKTPGFDILLHNVSQTSFFLIEKDLYIYFNNGYNEIEYLVSNIERKIKEKIVDETSQ